MKWRRLAALFFGGCSVISDANDGWDQFWRAAKSSEVLVTDTGAKNPALDSFWESRLRGIEPQHAVIDVGCGAGSVCQRLSSAEAFLVGTDISQVALSRAQQVASHVIPVRAASERMPFQSRSFDWVVSQFGVEYGGIEGLTEACALAKPCGHICFLIHAPNSAIQRSAERDLHHVEVIIETGFLAAARSLTTALAKQEEKQLEVSSAAFTEAETQLRAQTVVSADNFAGYSYLGFQSLLRRWARYEPQDILDWLNQMEREAAEGLLRLRAMRAAALDDDKWGALLDSLAPDRSSALYKYPVYSESSQQLLGWEVTNVPR